MSIKNLTIPTSKKPVTITTDMIINDGETFKVYKDSVTPTNLLFEIDSTGRIIVKKLYDLGAPPGANIKAMQIDEDGVVGRAP
jgi:hypothetical protein